MRSFSIKRRIVTAVVATELVLVACLLALATSVMRSHALRSFDTALHGRALGVAALVRYSESPHPELVFDNSHVPRAMSNGVADWFRIETQGGRVLVSSQMSGADTALSVDGDAWNFASNGTPYRAVRLRDVPVLDSEEDAPKEPESLQVVYAASTLDMRRNLDRALISILLGGILLLAISVYASIHAIEKGLWPLSELAASASAISTRDWTLPIPPSAARVSEIAPLASALSEMVNRLRSAFQQQRDFTSNAAHELRTPVAILKSTLQLLLQEPRSGEVYRSGISDALSDLARLEMLLHSMLRLARAEQQIDGTTAAERSRIDIIGTCEAAIARLAPLAASLGATMSLTAPSEPLPVRAEPEDLEIVWANLIENAIRHGRPDSEVKVIAERRNGFVAVAVLDNGNGIPPADVPRMFDRFYRGDQSRSRESGGYGLGLAIAKAVVESCGGSISATSVTPRGTRISVELPISD
jgi:signal transduction histidine kinase